MTKNENTVTLPVAPSGQVWLLCPETINVFVGCKGRVDKVYTIPHAKVTYDLRAAAEKQGYGRWLSTAPTSIDSDASDAEVLASVESRFASVIAGSYRPGSGGGGKRVTTLMVVLLERMPELMRLNLGTKAADAAKAIKASPETVYRLVCDKRAESLEGETGESLFAEHWTKYEANAQAEADRRESESKAIADKSDPFAY